MSYMNDFYPESRFGGFTEIDGTIPFYTRVNALLDPSFVVLDIGCGRGAQKDDHVPFRRELRILKNKVKKVIGIDVDKDASTNPFIDEFHLINGGGFHWMMHLLTCVSATMFWSILKNRMSFSVKFTGC